MELWDHFKVKYNSNSSNPKDGSDGFVIRLGEKGTITQESMKDFADYKLYFEREKIEYLDHYIHRNAWIKFFNSTNYKKEGWIDFEREMEKVLVVIDKLTSHTKDYYKDDTAYSHMLIEKLPYIECFAERLEERGLFLEQIISYEEELKEYRRKLLIIIKEEMEVLNKCLYIYLSEFVSKIRITDYSKQVHDLIFGDINTQKKEISILNSLSTT